MARETEGEERSDARDVDDLRSALNEARERFRSTVERIADGIVVLDGDGDIVFANPAAGRLFGRIPEELTGRSFGHPLAPGRTAEIDVVGADGENRVAEVRVVRTTWGGGDALLVSLRDVTERKAAEEQARELAREQAARAAAEESAERERFLAEASRRLNEEMEFDAILRATAEIAVPPLADACLVDVLRAEGGRELRRHAVAVMEGECPSLEPLRRHRLSVDSGTAAARILETGETLFLEELDEKTILETWGENDAATIGDLQPVAALLVPLAPRDEDPIGVLSLLVCGERAVGDREIRLARELGHRVGRAIRNASVLDLARRANRSKDDFLTVISHELKTPLTAISGYAGLLLEEIRGELNEDQRNYLEGINRSASHLLRLIEEMISFASSRTDREALRWEPVLLGEIVEDITTMIRPLARDHDLELNVRIPEKPLSFRTDRDKVRQIVVNLLSNAVKFTTEGDVTLEVEREDASLVFRVSDTGIGIPEEKRDQIFQAFRQVEDPRTRERGGIGIGLTVVRNLVDLLEGTVEMESEVGRGSTFTVRLPYRPAERDSGSVEVEDRPDEDVSPISGAEGEPPGPAEPEEPAVGDRRIVIDGSEAGPAERPEAPEKRAEGC